MGSYRGAKRERLGRLYDYEEGGGRGGGRDQSVTFKFLAINMKALQDINQTINVYRVWGEA